MSTYPNQSQQGEKNPYSRLTEEQVLAIYHDPSTHRETAERYGVSRGTVAAIRTGQRWAWLTNPELGSDRNADEDGMAYRAVCERMELAYAAMRVAAEELTMASHEYERQRERLLRKKPHNLG